MRVAVRRLLADVWPARALPGVLRALGGVPRLVLRFWEHYEVLSFHLFSFSFCFLFWQHPLHRCRRIGS
jgi:hypothetical protein